MASIKQAYMEVVVPRHYVKRIKSALEDHKLLNKSRKIAQHASPTEEDEQQPCMAIPTTIPFLGSEETTSTNGLLADETRTHIDGILRQLGLTAFQDEISISSYIAHDEYLRGNPVLKAFRSALEAFPEDLLISLELSVDLLVSTFPESYTIYRPMLLLPHNTFTSPPWKALLAAHPAPSPALQPVWQTIAAAVGTTHMALNAGIPPQTQHDTTTTANGATDTYQENILRSPTNLTPLLGTFGPPPSPRTLFSPSPDDFHAALWVHHTQNGIHQTWAPLYTMFSRGNIREKTRLLALPSVTSAPHCTAVDLYAGIGYFAFSYKKAGAGKVLCFELNPWSIEGLKRGAARNGWTTRVLTKAAEGRGVESVDGDGDEDADFLVFACSNEHALDVLPLVEGSASLPPVRHVNCGFLPSSRLSWRAAVGILDREVGGWIHAHENVGVRDVERRKGEVVAEMGGYLDDVERGGGDGGRRRQVVCEHVQTVKTYAPGVLHVVFDVWISGIHGVENV